MDAKELIDAEIRATMTSEQILLERKLTCEAINGAMAFGYQDSNPPPSEDHWLAPFWKIGRKQAELEARAAIPSDAAQAPNSDVILRIKRPEDYEGVDAQLMVEDFIATARRSDAWQWEVIAVTPTSTVAPAAAAPINLEGLRKKLLTPRKILRDDHGWLTHPDYPICDEGTRTDKFLEAFGIETRFHSMENDLPDLHERWCDEGMDDCSEWTPTPPEGDGWLLLEIYDTEDGPYAMFGRDKYEAENALKRQRMRAQLDRIQQLKADKGAAQ